MSDSITVHAYVPLRVRGTLEVPEPYAWQDVEWWTVRGRTVSLVMLDATVHTLPLSLGAEAVDYQEPDPYGSLLLDQPLSALLWAQDVHDRPPAPRLDRPRLELCQGVGPGFQLGAPVPIGSEADDLAFHRFELQVYAQVGDRWRGRGQIGHHTEYAGLCATQEARCLDEVRELFGKPRFFTVDLVARLVLSKVPSRWKPFGADPVLVDGAWDERAVTVALETLGETPESAARSVALVREELRYTPLAAELEPTELAWLIRRRLARLPRFVDLATRILACGPDHSLGTAHAATHTFAWRDDNLDTVMNAYRRWEFRSLAEAVRRSLPAGPGTDAHGAATATSA